MAKPTSDATSRFHLEVMQEILMNTATIVIQEQGEAADSADEATLPSLVMWFAARLARGQRGLEQSAPWAVAAAMMGGALALPWAIESYGFSFWECFVVPGAATGLFWLTTIGLLMAVKQVLLLLYPSPEIRRVMASAVSESGCGRHGIGCEHEDSNLTIEQRQRRFVLDALFSEDSSG